MPRPPSHPAPPAESRGAARAAAPAPCATTWRAYNATPFALPRAGLHYFWGTGGLEQHSRGLSAFNLYRDHTRG